MKPEPADMLSKCKPPSIVPCSSYSSLSTLSPPEASSECARRRPSSAHPTGPSTPSVDVTTGGEVRGSAKDDHQPVVATTTETPTKRKRPNRRRSYSMFVDSLEKSAANDGEIGGERPAKIPRLFVQTEEEGNETTCFDHVTSHVDKSKAEKRDDNKAVAGVTRPPPLSSSSSPSLLLLAQPRGSQSSSSSSSPPPLSLPVTMIKKRKMSHHCDAGKRNSYHRLSSVPASLSRMTPSLSSSSLPPSPLLLATFPSSSLSTDSAFSFSMSSASSSSTSSAASSLQPLSSSSSSSVLSTGSISARLTPPPPDRPQLVAPSASTSPLPPSSTSSPSSSSSSSPHQEVFKQTAEEELVSNLQKFYACSTLNRHNNHSCVSHAAETLADLDSGFQSLTIDRKCLRDKALNVGRKKFNVDPKRGIEYLVQAGLLKKTPDNVAEFLMRGEGLRKSAIGDFLGEKSDFNIDTLKAFVGLHNFSEALLVQALRDFLWNFRLPGEAQKIDRIMECFAERYCRANPGVFTNPDTCYILSFALIMLNTSLHNASVKDRLTPEKFEAMIKRSCTDPVVSSEMVMVLYKSIKREPLKLPDESGREDFTCTFFNPTKEGWLYKKSDKYATWKRRWFVLSDGCLYYFQSTEDKQPRAIIPLENLKANLADDKRKENCFEIIVVVDHHDQQPQQGAQQQQRQQQSQQHLYQIREDGWLPTVATGLGRSFSIGSAGSNNVIKSCKTSSSGKVVQGRRTSFKLAASSTEERLEWINCINQNVMDNPLQRLMSAKKRQNKTNKGLLAPSTPSFGGLRFNSLPRRRVSMPIFDW